MFSGAIASEKNQQAIKEINIDQFKENFLLLNQYYNIKSNMDFIIAVHIVFIHMINRNINHIRHIVVHLHYYEQNLHLSNRTIKNVRLLHDVFFRNKIDKTKMIAMIRNPLESYYSCVKLTRNLGLDYFFIINHYTLSSYYHLLKYMLTYEKQNFYIMDMNELHRSHLDCLKELCHFLNIGYNDSLERSTLHGYDWYGISANHCASNTFDSSKSLLKYPEKLDEPEYLAYFCFLSYLFNSINKHFKLRQEKYSNTDYVASIMKILVKCFNVKNIKKKILVKEHLSLTKTYRTLNYIFNENCSLLFSKIVCMILNSVFVSKIVVIFSRLQMIYRLLLYRYRISILLNKVNCV